MRDRFFILAKEAVTNDWTTESYCRTGGFTSRPFGKILSDICDLPREN